MKSILKKEKPSLYNKGFPVCVAPNGVQGRVFAPNGVRGHKLYYLAYFASVLNGSTYPKCVYAEPKSSSIRFV